MLAVFYIMLLGRGERVFGMGGNGILQIGEMAGRDFIRKPYVLNFIPK